MEQTKAAGSYTEVTRGIRVSVVPKYVKERSNPDQAAYAFSYQVMMENQGQEVVQLINRHWRVFSNERQIADVKGEGVVGDQPVLEPESVYQYTSWTVIDAPYGHMTGTYTFRTERGEFFDVQIPRFELLYLTADSFH